VHNFNRYRCYVKFTSYNPEVSHHHHHHVHDCCHEKSHTKFVGIFMTHLHNFTHLAPVGSLLTNKVLMVCFTMYFILKMETLRSSKMLVSYYNITWCHYSEDIDLNLHCCENLKSHNRLKVFENKELRKC
jgi:hypothetical protein